LMVDARLHRADIITHDEEDVGFLLGLCLRKTWHARHHHGGEQSEQAGPALSGHIHGSTPLYWPSTQVLASPDQQSRSPINMKKRELEQMRLKLIRPCVAAVKVLLLKIPCVPNKVRSLAQPRESGGGKADNAPQPMVTVKALSKRQRNRLRRMANIAVSPRPKTT
jgi:hypothetical protein